MSVKLRQNMSASLLLFFCMFTAAQAQELPPGAVLSGQPVVQNDGSLFDKAIYISDFKCLVQGQNWQREPACEYYQALINQEKQPDNSSSKICFKEATRVSYPRQYKTDKSYRLIYPVGEYKKNDYLASTYNYSSQTPLYDPHPHAVIVSQTGTDLPFPKRKGNGFVVKRTQKAGHAITNIIIYDCSTQYDGKSYN